jgi:hypothetical protein
VQEGKPGLNKNRRQKNWGEEPEIKGKRKQKPEEKISTKGKN